MRYTINIEQEPYFADQSGLFIDKFFPGGTKLSSFMCNLFNPCASIREKGLILFHICSLREKQSSYWGALHHVGKETTTDVLMEA